MKHISALLFAFAITCSAYSQNYLQDGDRCFNNGDYACATAKYNEAFRLAKGRDKQIAEIKLTRTKWCADHLKIANQAFNRKDYKLAKENYQSVLESNPKDAYAKSQMEKCNNALSPPATTLSVSKDRLSFYSSGGSSERITVYSNANAYSVSLVPSWCSVQTYNGYFVVTCNANNSAQLRSDWFKVTAGGKEVNIYINQSGTTKSAAGKSNSQTVNNNKCFNCPQTKDTWGLTLGYTQRTFDDYSLDGVQFGLRIEPLLKYGFGFNTGIMLESYSRSDTQLSETGYEQYAVNIPLHFEYRLNFSKWFNIFAYGGAGFNVITNSSFDDYTLSTCFEYGGGLRISHVQFNVGRSLYMGVKSYQNLVVSISYMF
ncbi:MAG: hypothetical protein LBS55_00485 [Prevotellaceae bacterium]|jgi:tetratricopeptide (TPR) repeat protein|nr:hypothetical protein [Prevotellaceae bacterium]